MAKLIAYQMAEDAALGSPVAFEIKGIPGRHTAVLFDGIRLDKFSIPEGKHLYGIRHEDNDWGSPATIAPALPLVNFFGSLVTTEEIPVTEETDFIDFTWL